MNMCNNNDCLHICRSYTNIRGFGATHHQHFEDNFFSAQRNIYSFQFLHLWSNFEICFFQKGPTTFLPFVITIYILQFLFFNLITSPILRKVIFFQFRCTLTTSKVEFPLHWEGWLVHKLPSARVLCRMERFLRQRPPIFSI